MSRILYEGLEYQDLKDMILATVTVDEYEAMMGKDSDIVTLAFTVKSKEAGKDLSSWFERGYDFVLDAKVSEGELEPGKYLVFVEMYRRLRVPDRIIELLSDLETLCGFKLKEWTVKLDDHELEPKAELIKKHMLLSPHEYRVKKEQAEALNEFRNTAGLAVHKIFDAPDSEIQNIKNIAGV